MATVKNPQECRFKDLKSKQLYLQITKDKTVSYLKIKLKDSKSNRIKGQNSKNILFSFKIEASEDVVYFLVYNFPNKKVVNGKEVDVKIDDSEDLLPYKGKLASTYSDGSETYTNPSYIVNYSYNSSIKNAIEAKLVWDLTDKEDGETVINADLEGIEVALIKINSNLEKIVLALGGKINNTEENTNETNTAELPNS